MDETPDPHCRIRSAKFKESGMTVYSFDNRIDPETELGITATAFTETFLGMLRDGRADNLETIVCFAKFDDDAEQNKIFFVQSNNTENFASVIEYIKNFGWGMLLQQALVKNSYEQNEEDADDDQE